MGDAVKRYIGIEERENLVETHHLIRKNKKKMMTTRQKKLIYNLHQPMQFSSASPFIASLLPKNIWAKLQLVMSSFFFDHEKVLISHDTYSDHF